MSETDDPVADWNARRNAPVRLIADEFARQQAKDFPFRIVLDDSGYVIYTSFRWEDENHVVQFRLQPLEYPGADGELLGEIIMTPKRMHVFRSGLTDPGQYSNQLSDEVATAIEKLPGKEGWWASGNKEDFERAALLMKHAGMSDSRIREVLEMTHGATKAEYGD